MLFLQMLAAAFFVVFLQQAGAIELQPFSFDRARSLAPIALLYCSNTAFALASLEGMSIPMCVHLPLLDSFTLMRSIHR